MDLDWLVQFAIFNLLLSFSDWVSWASGYAGKISSCLTYSRTKPRYMVIRIRDIVGSARESQRCFAFEAGDFDAIKSPSSLPEKRASRQPEHQAGGRI